MPGSNLKALIGKLNPTCRKRPGGGRRALSLPNPLRSGRGTLPSQLQEISNTDIQKILRHFEINETRLVSI